MVARPLAVAAALIVAWAVGVPGPTGPRAAASRLARRPDLSSLRVMRSAWSHRTSW
jgi:hypothetical protein